MWRNWQHDEIKIVFQWFQNINTVRYESKSADRQAVPVAVLNAAFCSGKNVAFILPIFRFLRSFLKNKYEFLGIGQNLEFLGKIFCQKEKNGWRLLLVKSEDISICTNYNEISTECLLSSVKIMCHQKQLTEDRAWVCLDGLGSKCAKNEVCVVDI